jgi:hypothetical protein
VSNEVSVTVQLADSVTMTQVVDAFLQSVWEFRDVDGASFLAANAEDTSDWVMFADASFEEARLIIAARDEAGLPGGVVLMANDSDFGATVLLLDQRTVVATFDVNRWNNAAANDLNDAVRRVVRPLSDAGMRVERYSVEVESPNN